MRRAGGDAGEDRVLAGLDETRHILADAHATRERLLRELEELRDNLRRFRDTRRDGPDRLDGGARDDARV
jgi:hypothetical protein